MIPQNVSSNGQHRKSIGLGDVSIVSQGNDEQYQTKELIWGKFKNNNFKLFIYLV